MKTLVFLFCLVFSLVGFAQNLIPSPEWTTVGLPFEKEERETLVINFDEKKAELGNNLNDDQVLEAIFLSRSSDLVILFSEKEYHFKEQIKLKSYCSLKGSGPSTTFVFDLEKEVDAILVQGQLTKDTVRLGVGVQDDICDFDGDVIKVQSLGFYLLADNDAELVESWWAKGKTGQMVELKEVSEGYLQFKESVWRAYNNEAYLIKMKPVRQVEISDLTIINNSKTETQTSTICFRFAFGCLVKNVQSKKSNYAHVLFEFSAHSGVKSSTFEKAHDYGNGGKGYGVVMQFATSSCFIEHCKFDSLRHAILLQAGANHNYIAYNESTNPFWTDVKLPASSAGDIVLHGNFTYANLFEFNKCQTIVIDNSHGINGPYNTFFGNEVSGYGIWQLRGSSCGPQYFINNILTGDKVRFKAKDKEYHQYNLLNGKLIESGTTKHTYKTMIQGSVRY